MKGLHDIPKGRETPTPQEVRVALTSTEIRAVEISSPILLEFLARLRKNHSNGEAHLLCFEIGPNAVYDFYTSRNRWSFDAHTDILLEHPAILSQLSIIRAVTPITSGLVREDNFKLDGYFASLLYNGGAYWHTQGDGREEKEFAIKVCDQIFGLRYGEISCDTSGAGWTPWFFEIAWDFTIVIFDNRCRRMWLFAITDTD
jgi:hypothetical protein